MFTKQLTVYQLTWHHHEVEGGSWGNSSQTSSQAQAYLDATNETKHQNLKIKYSSHVTVKNGELARKFPT